MSNKFERHIFECNVYMDQKGGSLFFIVLYVDGLLIGSSSAVGLRSIKSALSEAFTMIDLGLLKQFIGLEVSQKNSGIMISQSRYSLDILIRFHMEDCKETPFPFLSGIGLEEGGSTSLVDNTLFRQLIDNLLYLTHSRPDISYCVSAAARYMQEP